MTEQRSDTSLPREQEEILSRYADILNGAGAGSAEETAFLEKYVGDEEVLKLLRAAKAVKTLFEVYGKLPDLGSTAASCGGGGSND